MKEAISGILAVIAMFAAVGVGGYVEHNYTLKDCEVVRVYQDKTVVEDQSGNLWEFVSNDYTFQKLHPNLLFPSNEPLPKRNNQTYGVLRKSTDPFLKGCHVLKKNFCASYHRKRVSLP